MHRPIQPALGDAAPGRMSMPFLPTLAVAIVLAAASMLCPSAERAPPAAPLTVAAAPGPTDFARPVAVAAPVRLPGSLAFAEAFPAAQPAATGAAAAPPRAAAARPAQHVASVARKSCPGRRCTEIPQRAALPQPGEADPLAAARAQDAARDAARDTAEASEDGILPPLALPFAASARSAVARTLAPAARVVGEAADLVRGGATSVTGSVVLLADCLP